MKKLSDAIYETYDGYLKNYGLYCGDILENISDNDIIVMTLFIGDYKSEKYSNHSVIRAVESKFHCTIEKLANEPLLDMRQALNTWMVLIPCVESDINIRLVVMESNRHPKNYSIALHDLSIFLDVAEKKGKIQPKSVLRLPLAFGGRYTVRKQPDLMRQIAKEQISTCREILKTSSYIDDCRIIEIDALKAKKLHAEWELTLGHGHVVRLEDKKTKDLCKEIIACLDRRRKCRSKEEEWVSEIRSHLNEGVVSNTKFPQKCRKWVEIILNELLKLQYGDGELQDRKRNGISDEIESLCRKKELKHGRVAHWIVGYLHVIRLFGNFASHEHSEKLIPKNLRDTDLYICLQCLNAVIGFWIDLERISKDK